MATNKQRREAERRRLQRQLEQRREREAARKQFTLIASIVGTLAVIAVVIIVIVAATGGGDGKKKKDAAASNDTVSSAPADPRSSTPTAQPQVAAPAACTKPGTGATASYQGVTVGNATDLKKEPKVRSSSTKPPKALLCQDLVVGKGAPASPASTVTVQYSGVLYANGKMFDSSWSRKQAATFSLAQVVPGFTQGIGGAGKVAPMRAGGRRIMILPAALGYGAQGQGAIPANSPLVFVVDLVKVSG